MHDHTWLEAIQLFKVTWLSDLMTLKSTKTNHKRLEPVYYSWKCNLRCLNSVFICGRLCRNVLWDLEWLLLHLHHNERSRTDMVSLTLLLQQAWTTGGGKCPTVILKLVSGESIVSIIMLVSLCACPFSETIVFDD
jgi:hypothetical protein